MSQLICHIDLFSIEQEIYLYEVNKAPTLLGVCKLSSLGEALAALCPEINAQKIHLYGNASYIEEEVIKTFNLNYKNNIEIEVN